MKGFGVLAGLIMLWIIVSYIIVGISYIPFVNFGLIENYAKLTIKYIVFFLLNFIMFISLIFVPHIRGKGAVGIVIAEVIFAFVTIAY
jgi:hypothetical protein